MELSAQDTQRFTSACKAAGLTVTNVLGAAMACLVAEAVHGTASIDKDLKIEKYRFLLSVGMRSFGTDNMLASGQRRNLSADWTGGTVACAGGAVDYVLAVPPEARQFFSDTVGSVGVGGGAGNENVHAVEKSVEKFLQLGRDCKDGFLDILKAGYVTESVRLFGLGMQYADILPMVEADAAGANLGRGYSFGVSNVGIQSFSDAISPPIQDIHTVGKGDQKVSWDVEIEKAFYGTSHSRNGVLVQLSCMTVSDKFCGCLQFPYPIINKVTSATLALRLQSFLTNFKSNSQ